MLGALGYYFYKNNEVSVIFESDQIRGPCFVSLNVNCENYTYLYSLQKLVEAPGNFLDKRSDNSHAFELN
jgi:hypothetical protein